MTKKKTRHNQEYGCDSASRANHTSQAVKKLGFTTLRLFIPTGFRTPWKPELLVRSSETEKEENRPVGSHSQPDR